MASDPITSWQREGEKVKAVTDFIFLGTEITPDGDCSHEIKRHLLLRRRAMTNLVHFSSVTELCPTLSPHGQQQARPPCPSQLPELVKLMSIESVVPSEHLILCHPLLLLPSILLNILKDPYSQSYGFSSCHVWVWELYHKGGWMLKNWCFWIVVLEKTLENPLDCKENQTSLS